MSGLLKNIILKAEISPIVIWRLILFKFFLRLAVWVGGFGGIEVVPFDPPAPPPKGQDSGNQRLTRWVK